MKRFTGNNRIHPRARRIIAVFVAALLFLGTLGPVFSAYPEDFKPGQSVKSLPANTAAEIDAAFPESYRAELKALLKAHPKWKFQAYYTGLTWESAFTKDNEMYPTRNLTYYKDVSGLGITKEWYSTTVEGAYNWANNAWQPYDSGTWYQSSEKAVRFCMDPRNFLTETQIFQFLDGSASIGNTEAESIAIIKKLLDSKSADFAFWKKPAAETGIYTEREIENPEYIEYLKRKEEEESSSESESGESESSGESKSEEKPTESEVIPPETIIVKDPWTYAEALGKICYTLNVNESMILSRLLQEQGVGNSVLISGTRQFTVTKGDDKGKTVDGGYYQYFNIGASGNSMDEIINNGLTEAYNGGWDTRYKALYGGISAYKNKYIDQGQSNLYMQKFNVNSSTPSRVFWYQYMQNVTAPQTECLTLRSSMVTNGMLDSGFTFLIPVFKDMPEAKSPKPTDDRNPNYKLGAIYIDEESVPDFDTDKTDYGIIDDLTFEKKSVVLNAQSYAPESTVTVTVTFNGTDTNVSVEKDTYDAGGRVYGFHSAEIPLFVGVNDITVKCSAENGDSREYTFSFVRHGEPGPGDVNLDGEIDIFDIALLRDRILGYTDLTDEQFALGDLDQDKEITVFDIAVIRDYILGYIDEITYPEPEPTEEPSVPEVTE